MYLWYSASAGWQRGAPVTHRGGLRRLLADGFIGVRRWAVSVLRRAPGGWVAQGTACCQVIVVEKSRWATAVVVASASMACSRVQAVARRPGSGWVADP